MTDTPRTDDVEELMGGLHFVLADFARELECESAELLSVLRDLFGACQNEMVARGLPVEWQDTSPMGRAQTLISKLEGKQ